MRWSDSRKAPTELARGTGADQGSALRQEGPTHGHGGPRWAWWALGLVYLAVVGACLTVQPLGVPPDEIAHIQYAEFIASQGRLPIWSPQDGGEAGYESQHPPVFYLVAAGLYRLTEGLAARWRWTIVRLLSVVCGLVILLVCQRLFEEVLPQDSWWPLLATSVVVLMPTVMFYASHINPDIMVLMWSALVLWLACRVRWQPGNLRLVVLLGILSALGTLTKVSAGPLFLVALIALGGWIRDPAGGRHRTLRGMGVLLLVFLLTCGWYFRMNYLLYGTFVIHTPSLVGSAVEEAFTTTRPLSALWVLGKLMAKNTYLSTWAPVSWLPAGEPTIPGMPWYWQMNYCKVLLYGLLTVFAVAGLAGLLFRRRTPVSQDNPHLRSALNLSGWLALLVVLGHQAAYWLSDVNFNMGGRYIMVAMPALALLLISGLRQWGPRVERWLAVWPAVLVIISVVGMWTLVTYINPKYTPGWRPFHFSIAPAPRYPGQYVPPPYLPPGADQP